MSTFFRPDPKPLPKAKAPHKGLKRSAIKHKPVGNTDQSDAMQEKYAEQKGICEVTGVDLGEYDPFKVHHFLSKKTYSRFKNEKFAMIVIDMDLHYSYHNNSKEYVISTFGVKANILYDRADELRIIYNTKPPTI